MPRSLQVDVDPEIFKWLRVSSGWTLEEISKRLKTSVDAVEAIESGRKKPTLWQLKMLSKAYKRPVASFFLSETLPEPPLPKDYRVISDRKGVFDKNTIYAIRRARELQDLGSELSKNIEYPTKPKFKNITINQEPEDLATLYRNQFALTEEKQKELRNAYQLFNYLRDSLENINILVFQFSMPLDDARGFVLTDKTPNVIVVNKKDSIEARSFTLIHEFGHVLLGETVIDMPNIIVKSLSAIERWCNIFAARLLFPKKMAIQIFNSNKRNLTETNTLRYISNKYKVSKAMILYSMHEMGYISKGELNEVLDRYQPDLQDPIELERKEKVEEEKGFGIPADKRCLSEVGNKFVSIVAHNYDGSHITYNDALDYLAIRSHNFNKVLSKAKK